MRPFKPSYIIEVLPQLLPYLLVTLLIMVCVVLLGSFLGFFLARARMRRRSVSKLLADAYIGVLRCTPPIVLLFIVFYGLPKLLMVLFGVNINGAHSGVFVLISFTLLFAAPMAEIMRSAYLAIEPGQREAAVSAGLSEAQAFVYIVLPQATAVALPNFGNALINLMKDGSLAYTIGLIDVMGQGTLIIARNFGSYSLETYLALTLIYWSMTLLIEQLFGRLERNFSKGKKTISA